MKKQNYIYEDGAVHGIKHWTRGVNLEDHEKATEGIECRKDKAILDESPAAYKDIHACMEAQDDLVEIVAQLRQVVNVKG